MNFLGNFLLNHKFSILSKIPRYRVLVDKHYQPPQNNLGTKYMKDIDDIRVILNDIIRNITELCDRLIAKRYIKNIDCDKSKNYDECSYSVGTKENEFKLGIACHPKPGKSGSNIFEIS